MATKTAAKKTTKEPKAAKVKAKKEPKAAKVTAPKEPKQAKEPKAKKAKPTKEPKPFAHDPRVLPFVGKTLTHTERDGTRHEMKVLASGFEVAGVMYNSATAAAKPLQPIDSEGKSRAVNGLVYWNIVKTPRAAIAPEAALESAQKAIDKALERSGVAGEAAGDKRGAVTRAMQGAVKKFEKLLTEGAALA